MGDAVLDAALADYQRRVHDGEGIRRPANYIRAAARRMAAEQTPQTCGPCQPADPSTLTDDQLRRRLRATRVNGPDRNLILEGLRREMTVDEVAFLTGIEGGDWLRQLAAQITDEAIQNMRDAGLQIAEVIRLPRAESQPLPEDPSPYTDEIGEAWT